MTQNSLVIGLLIKSISQFQSPLWEESIISLQVPKKLFKKDFTVTFADYENKLLDDDLKLQYTKLNQLIAWIDDAKSIANADLKLLLISLRNDLGDVQKTRGNVIQVEDYLAKKTTKLSKKAARFT